MRLISNSRRLSPSVFFRKSKSNIFQYLPKGRKCFITSSGRGGLEVCIDLLKLTPEDTVLLPTFVAQGVISPFNKKKINVDFYKLKNNLIVDLEYLDLKLRSNSSIKVMVAIHYFGFAQPIKKIKELCEKNGVILIEDCAQSLFSKQSGEYLGSTGDISFFSLAKTLPVPDGSIFIINNRDIPAPQIKYRVSVQYLLSIGFHTFTLMWAYVCGKHYGGSLSKLLNLPLLSYDVYYVFLKQMPNPAPISLISRCLLTKLDYPEIIKKRKRNADFFFDHIDLAKYRLLFSRCSEESVLMSIPVISENRNEIKRKLLESGIDCGIFGQKIWDYIPKTQKGNFMSEDRFVQQHLLIPIYHDLTIQEMAFISRTMNGLSLNGKNINNK